MRIIAGRCRGLALAAVGKGDAGAHLRPTSDRVRESLFNVLMGGAYGDPVTDAVVLDLFAGTGALALEAMSRGAAQATLVDTGGKALSLIRQNIRLTRSEDAVRVVKRDATRLGEATGAAATLVFLDPPYGQALGERALAAARRGGWIAPGALVVWEERAAQAAPGGFTGCDARRYGDTWITFLEADP